MLETTSPRGGVIFGWLLIANKILLWMVAIVMVGFIIADVKSQNIEPLTGNYGNITLIFDGVTPVIVFSNPLVVFNITLLTANNNPVNAIPFYNAEGNNIKFGLQSQVILNTPTTFSYLVKSSKRIQEYGTNVFKIEDRKVPDCPDDLFSDCHSDKPFLDFSQICEPQFIYTGDDDSVICETELYPGCEIVFNPSCSYTQMDDNYTLKASFTLPSGLLNIDPQVTFDSLNVEAIHMVSLGKHRFVIAYCEEVGDDIKGVAYHTNGTLLNTVTFDSNVGACFFDYQVSVSAIDNETVTVAWYDYGVTDAYMWTWDTTLLTLVSPTTVDNNVINTFSIATAQLNNTDSVIIWNSHLGGGKLRAERYHGTTSTSGKIDVISGSANMWAIDGGGFGDQFDSWFTVHSSKGGYNYSYATYYGNMTYRKNDTVIESTGINFDIAGSALNSSAFVACYVDNPDPVGNVIVKCTVIDIDGNTIYSPYNVKSTAGSAWIATTKINETAFGVAFQQASEGSKTAFYMLEHDGTLIQNMSIRESSGFGHVASQQSHPQTQICDDNYIIGWSNITYFDGVFRTFYANGSYWPDGECNPCHYTEGQGDFVVPCECTINKDTYIDNGHDFKIKNTGTLYIKNKVENFNNFYIPGGGLGNDCMVYVHENGVLIS